MAAADASLAATTAVFRRFNRAYTRFLGTLNESYLSTGYGLAEGRVLYELATHSKPQAKEVAQALDLDTGYLSRTLSHTTLMLSRHGRAKQVCPSLLLTNYRTARKELCHEPSRQQCHRIPQPSPRVAH